MSSRPEILANVKTLASPLYEEEAILLGIGKPIERTVADIQMACRAECALGAQACNLEMKLIERADDPIAIQAQCEDCRNPQFSLKAVRGLLDLSDRRKAAIDDVPLWEHGGKEAKKANDDFLLYNGIENNIEKLEVGVRTYNCLMRGGITTIDQLASLSEEELKKILNFSLRSIEEVKQELARLGLGLMGEQKTE